MLQKKQKISLKESVPYAIPFFHIIAVCIRTKKLRTQKSYHYHITSSTIIQIIYFKIHKNKSDTVEKQNIYKIIKDINDEKIKQYNEFVESGVKRSTTK